MHGGQSQCCMHGVPRTVDGQLARMFQASELLLPACRLHSFVPRLLCIQDVDTANAIAAVAAAAAAAAWCVCLPCRWRCGYIAYPGQQLLQKYGGVQDLAAELLKVCEGWLHFQTSEHLQGLAAFAARQTLHMLLPVHAVGSGSIQVWM
jgi:hypothetical protein